MCVAGWGRGAYNTKPPRRSRIYAEAFIAHQNIILLDKCTKDDDTCIFIPSLLIVQVQSSFYLVVAGIN